jgi:hypothetical protein
VTIGSGLRASGSRICAHSRGGGRATKKSAAVARARPATAVTVLPVARASVRRSGPCWRRPALTEAGRRRGAGLPVNPKPPCAKIGGTCPGHPAHGRHRDRSGHSGSVQARRSLAVRASLPARRMVPLPVSGAPPGGVMFRGHARCHCTLPRNCKPSGGPAGSWPLVVPPGGPGLGRCQTSKLLRVQKHAHERIASEMPHENFS